MAKQATGTSRRAASLSRASIVDAAIELLDGAGEAGLTFRALAERLATGAGAIYWHVADKNDLLTAACDTVVARTLDASSGLAAPDAAIRAIALALFDAIDAHPWVGSALIQSPGQTPTVRILEQIGQQVGALGMPNEQQFASACAIQNYILGVGAQNAANGQRARARGYDRSTLMDAVSTAWSALDPDIYPFVRRMAGALRVHDDRDDFLAGIDLILSGLAASQRRGQP